MTQWYKAEFYSRDPDTGRYKYNGSVNVSDDCVTNELPLATKAFRAAAPQVKLGAMRVTFTPIYSY